MVLAPSPPLIVSLPSPPLIRSVSGPPVSTSLPSVPTWSTPLVLSKANELNVLPSANTKLSTW